LRHDRAFRFDNTGEGMSEAGNWVRVAAIADVAEGSMLAVDVNGQNLAIYHLDGGDLCATSNVCTHAFAMLTDGWLEGNVIECPLHAGQFDVRTGKGLCPPIEEDLQTFPVKVEAGEFLVNLG
jgi:nitrite reductase/ring-hydroxylating ferredoxin subunit